MALLSAAASSLGAQEGHSVVLADAFGEVWERHLGFDQAYDLGLCQAIAHRESQTC